jgi:hypothetical protein
MLDKAATSSRLRSDNGYGMARILLDLRHVGPEGSSQGAGAQAEAYPGARMQARMYEG